MPKVMATVSVCTSTAHPLAMKEYFMKTQFEILILNVICVAHRKTQHDKKLNSIYEQTKPQKFAIVFYVAKDKIKYKFNSNALELAQSLQKHI